MLPHLDEIFRLGHVGRDTGRHRQPERRSFRISEEIGRLKAPQRLDLVVRNADLVKMIGTMRLAMPASAGKAGHGEDKLLQLSRHLAFREYKLDHLVPGFAKFGPVAHLEFLPVLIGCVIHLSPSSCF